MKRKLFLTCAAAAICCAFSGLESRAFAQITLRSADDALALAAANDREGELMKKAALEEVRLAKLSLAPFLPEFDFSISDTGSAEKGAGDYKQKTLEAGVTQKIFNGGKSLLEYNMKKERGYYNFLEVQKSQESKKNKIEAAYYAALLAMLKSEVYADAARVAEKVLRFAEIEEEEGLTSKTELLESRIKFMDIQGRKKSADDDFFSKCRNLNELLGIDARQKLDFAQNFDIALDDGGRPELSFCLQELWQKAVEKNVDLKKAGAEARWAKKKLALERRAFLPSVSVRAGFAFSGRSYPLTEPSYSIKVILGFDNNPWLPMSLSKKAGIKKGALNSIADSLSGKAVLNTSWFSQMKLAKLSVEQSGLDAQKVRREIEGKVFSLAKGVENADKSARLNFETMRLKEQRLALCEIQLEQGEIKATDCLEAVNELAAQKIKFLEALTERDSMAKELEAMTNGR